MSFSIKNCSYNHHDDSLGANFSLDLVNKIPLCELEICVNLKFEFLSENWKFKIPLRSSQHYVRIMLNFINNLSIDLK